jgi:hypothetical protein
VSVNDVMRDGAPENEITAYSLEKLSLPRGVLIGHREPALGGNSAKLPWLAKGANSLCSARHSEKLLCSVDLQRTSESWVCQMP